MNIRFLFQNTVKTTAIFLTLFGGISIAQSTVTILQGVDATTMDPHLIQAAPESNILNHIFETLVYRDDNMTMQPRLARSWENVDALIWEFELRDDITFQNGEPFNAEAVKFSLERAVEKDTADIRQLQLDRVEVINDDTVRIHTTNPNPALLTALLAGWIVAPEHYSGLDEAGAASSPVGTGPYILEEWRRDDAVTLTQHSDYWGGDVSYETLIWRPIPEASTRLAELEVGNADLVANIPPESAERIATIEGIDVRSTPTGQRFYIGLRHDEAGPLQDARVRRALNHAVDVDLIIETLLGDLGERRATLLNPPHADPSLTPFTYDPELAEELLAEAGYPDGFEMTLMSPNGRYTRDLEIAQAVASFLREVGVEVTVEASEWGRYIDLMVANELRDAWLLGSGSYFDGQLEYNVFLGALEQLTWYNDEAFALWEELRQTVEEERRTEILFEMQRLMLEDPPVILLHRPVDLYGVNAALDWQPRADARIILY